MLHVNDNHLNLISLQQVSHICVFLCDLKQTKPETWK